MRRCLAVSVLILLSFSPVAPHAVASVPPEYAAPSLLTVILTRGDTLVALSAEPAPYQMVRITGLEGTYRFYPSNRIREIRDAGGADRTDDLLDRGRTIGTPPPQAAPEDSIRVTLDRGADLHVAYVKYVSLGSLLLVGANGRSRHVDASRVAAIEGPAGEDLTAAVIERRGDAGTPPLVWLRARQEPGFRLVARPLPECTSFALTEIGVLVPLRTADKTDEDHSVSVVLDYGWMKNLGPRHAVGFVVHGDLGASRLRLGPGVRYRRWFTRSSALDVAAGVLVAGTEEATNYDFDGPGIFGQVDYQVSGLLALTGQIETTALRYYPPRYVPSPAPPGSGVDVRLGAKLGAGLGIIGTVALAIPIAAVIAILAAGVD